MKKKVKIKQFNIIWMLGFLLLFRPANYLIGNTTNRILNYIVVGISILMVGIVWNVGKYGYKMSKPIKLIILLYFWVIVGSSVICTLLERQIDYSDVLVFFFSALLFVNLCDVGLWYSPRRTIKIFLIIGIFMCSINAVTMLLYGRTGGMYHEQIHSYIGRTIIGENYYFLGRDNATYFWSWPVLVVSWFYYYKIQPTKRVRIISLLYTALLVVSYVYVWSVQAAIACISVPLVLFLLVHALESEKKHKRSKSRLLQILKMQVVWIVGLVFNIALSLGALIAYFAPVIQNVFQKRITLTSRTYVWERAYAAIVKSPIIGFGCEPMEVSTTKLLINHTHNMFLETLYRGGIIGLILFVVLFFSVSKRTDKITNSAIHKFLIVMMLVFFICSAVYFAYYRYHYLLILILLCHNELFESNTK